jgi:hypothetical protein
MSACGTFRTSRDFRVESACRSKAEVGFRARQGKAAIPNIASGAGRAMASSMDCGGASAAERACDCDEGVQYRIFFVQVIYAAVCDCRCAEWWQAFTIRSKPLELSRRFRYILPVHTTYQGCPENVDFNAVFRGSRRGTEISSLSATIKQHRESPCLGTSFLSESRVGAGAESKPTKSSLSTHRTLKKI